MAQEFDDHFGAVSRQYVESRPTYPEALFAWLAAQSPGLDLAWDCGAGSGQASLALADHFARVVATDASASQLSQARAHPRVTYRVAPAEQSRLAERSVSLITVAQALHWFPLDAFYAEARRVLRPDGLIAAWTYAAFVLDHPAADALVREFHYETIGAWWPPERAHVETGYRSLPFPFTRVEPPTCHMVSRWTLAQVLGYLRSWSATARYVAAHRRDPVDDLERRLRDVWGDPAGRMTVEWPLTVLVGVVS